MYSEIKKALKSGLALIALFIFLLLTSCSSSKPKEFSQSQGQEEKYLQLGIRASDAEKKAAESQEALDKRNKEYELLVKERDKLVQERGDYPRDTPEDVVKENKSLRLQLLKNDVTSSVGYKKLVDMLEDNRELRAENWKLKKENQHARIYFEKQGVYLSSIDGKQFDITESPLYLEKAEHNVTRVRLKLAEEEKKAANIFYELGILKKDQELTKTINERELYKTGYEQWRAYAKSLETPKPKNQE